MLSPNRATFSERASSAPTAARDQVPMALSASLSCQCPTTTFRSRPRRVQMKPNSRSPWADWFRFMKSMSISDHGMSRLNCVWKCSSGFRSLFSPDIHIFAGEKVCIQAISPAQSGELPASRQTEVMASEVVSTGLKTTLAAIIPELSRAPAMASESDSTCFSVSSP